LYSLGGKKNDLPKGKAINGLTSLQENGYHEVNSRKEKRRKRG
jgi:hypothetical protein